MSDSDAPSDPGRPPFFAGRLTAGDRLGLLGTAAALLAALGFVTDRIVSSDGDALRGEIAERTGEIRSEMARIEDGVSTAADVLAAELAATEADLAASLGAHAERMDRIVGDGLGSDTGTPAASAR